MPNPGMSHSLWPELQYDSWRDTLETLHRWAQIVGKIRLSQSPWVNHSWHSTLYVSERGLTTSLIHGEKLSFSIEFDFISHLLRISRSDGKALEFPLVSESVAAFHERCVRALRAFGSEPGFFGSPNELADALPFEEDQIHRTYDPDYAHRLWRILLQADRLMKVFRSGFAGKVSPVHFFWGGFDLAVTRFSGRRAPEHPGGIRNLPDLVTRDAYSHEVSSCGFWPGDERYPAPAFYSYAYPMPPGFESALKLDGVFYHETLREFLLPYEVVRRAQSQDQAILNFFQKTYEAAADLGGWDRSSLEGSSYLKELQARGQERYSRRKSA